MKQARLLVVDDEPVLLKMVTTVLHKEGFVNLSTAASGQEALTLVQAQPFDLILLDVQLPDMRGYEVCTEIRRLSDVPIFFLTARSSDLDKISGFAYGADDYITKPFNPLELVARIKARLKRQEALQVPRQETKVHYIGDLEIRLEEGTAYKNGVPLQLTAQLFRLLCFFATSPNRIFSKEQIYEQVWGEMSFGDDTTVTVHIRKLREKIEDVPSKPRYLLTLRGLGYKFVSEVAQ